MAPPFKPQEEVMSIWAIVGIIFYGSFCFVLGAAWAGLRTNEHILAAELSMKREEDRQCGSCPVNYIKEEIES